MKVRLRKLRTVSLFSCLTLTVCGIASAQQPSAPDNAEQSSVMQSQSKNENQLPASDKDSDEFYLLTQATRTAFAAGETDKASAFAKALLKQAETMRKDWNYGNAIHVGNLILGRIAFSEGDLENAKRFLLKSGETPGSPQLKTFGPNMQLAKELLEKNEREVVIKYFDLCAKFWKGQDGKLDEWKALVLKGEMPDFQANLRY